MIGLEFAEPEDGRITKLCYRCFTTIDTEWDSRKGAYVCTDIKVCYKNLVNKLMQERKAHKHD